MFSNGKWPWLKVKTHNATNCCDPLRQQDTLFTLLLRQVAAQQHTCSVHTGEFGRVEMWTSSDLIWLENNWRSLIGWFKFCCRDLNTPCVKAACAYFVAAICCTNSNQWVWICVTDHSNKSFHSYPSRLLSREQVWKMFSPSGLTTALFTGKFWFFMPKLSQQVSTRLRLAFRK